MPEEGRGIAHRLIKPNRVEFVAKIIVSTDVAARAGLGVGPSEMEQPVDHALVEHGPCRLVQRFAVLQVKAQDGSDVTAFDITRHVAFGKADGAAADSTPDWPEILELQIAGGAGFGVSDLVHPSGRQCEGNAAGDITGQEFPPQCGDGVTEEAFPGLQGFGCHGLVVTSGRKSTLWLGPRGLGLRVKPFHHSRNACKWMAPITLRVRNGTIRKERSSALSSRKARVPLT